MTGSAAVSRAEVTLVVNGEPRTATVDVRTLLSDHLRHGLRLTGTHVGCEQGVCGACTVILDGRAVRSCLVLAVQCHDGEIETVEGLATGDGLHPVQTAFGENHALQCGFCTPGFLMSLVQYLRESDDPDDDDLLAALSGNLCRCTGYLGILQAARQAANELRTGGADERETPCRVRR